MPVDPSDEGDANVWESYRKFHAAGRKALAAGAARPLVVWRCLTGAHCGGNGDQIKGLLSTFYFAVQTKRLFFVQWERYNYSISKLLRPAYIDWHLPDHVRCRGEESVRMMTGAWTKLQHLGGESCLYLETNSGPSKARARLAGLDAYRPGCAFHYLMRPSPLLKGVLERRRPSLCVQAGACDALHLRFGDRQLASHVSTRRPHRSRRGMRISASPDKALMDALECMRQMAPGGRPVIVYSDGLAVKQLAVNDSWAARNAPGWHLDASRDESGNLLPSAHTDSKPRRLAENWTEGQLAERQSSVITAWADQWGLALAPRLVATRSGFSRWAIEIGMLDPEAVRELQPSDEQSLTCVRHESFRW